MRKKIQRGKFPHTLINSFELISFPNFQSKLLQFSTAVVFVFGILVCDVFAQNQEISGQVTSIEGEALPGVTIVVQGTSTGTTTNMDGNYSLTAPTDGTLIFTYIGFQRVVEEINGRSTIDIVMEESVSELQDVIVTGYTAQRRADITGAVSSVDIESIGRESSSSVLQRLDGRVSGITVDASGSPGSRSTVRIRGISSFQNNDPLYIIDGTPVQDSFANWLNPNDIESIQVLKDASAASIYGARANNGVIIIETKKGSEGAAQVSVDLRSGVSTPVNGYDNFLITDALEYHEVVKRAHENAGVPVPTNVYGDPNNPSVPNYTWPNDGVSQTNSVNEGDYAFPGNLIMPGSTGTNWWDAVFGPAFVQDYNVGISGGGSDHTYNVSFNYLDQEGTAAFNHYKRGTIRVNTQFDVGRFTIGENLSLAIDETVGGIPNDPGVGAEDGILGKNILLQPVIPVYDIAGNFASGKAVGLGNSSNPLKVASAAQDSPTRNTRVFGNVFARTDFFDRVMVTSRLGFNLSDGSSRGFAPMFPENSEPTFDQGISESNSVTRDWTWSNTANYIDTFSDVHNVNVLVGQEANQTTQRGIFGSMSGLITTDLNARYIQDAIGDPDTQNVSSFGFKASLLSFFGKVDYNYAQRYHLSATLRHDGSSRLGPNNRWGTFPAFSVGWRISNEPFMAENEFFSNIMLRAGWGITGNQNIPAGRTVDQFGGATGDTFYDIRGTGSSIVQGFRQSSLGNPDLQWEENKVVNAGLDLEFFEGRVNFELDVYQRDTDNLLFAPQIPASAGVAAPPVENVGKMRNTGFDVSLGYRGMINEDVSFTVSLNGSHYKNEILRIDGDRNFFFGPISTRFGNQVINQIGQPIGAFYGFIADGFFNDQSEVNAHADQAGAAPGRIRFRDVNGDGEINADDRTIIGDPHPDFTAGLDFGLQWKNWDINTTLFGTFGNDIFDVQKEFYVFRNFNTNVRRDLLTDSWTPENTDAKYPQLDVNDTFSSDLSSFYVEDGSYVRLRNLQIGYTVPAGVLPGFRSMRVYVQGENLFTITGYDGLDPSLPTANVTSAGSDVRDQYRGVDRGSYPSNRTISLGISARF